MSEFTHDGRPTIVLAANSSWNLHNFRAPILRRLRELGYRIVAAVPDSDCADRLEEMDAQVEVIAMDPRGLSLPADARLLFAYYRLLRRIRPAAFIPFTAKPNIYGSIAAAWARVPVINTVTGLGTGFLSGAALRQVMTSLYRVALGRSQRVFFHNCEDRDMFVDKGLVKEHQAAVVAGSGVDLERFTPAPPSENPHPVFLYVGRFLRDKGAGEFADAAYCVKAKHSAIFRMLGVAENHPKAVPPDEVERWRRDGVVELLGTVDDVRPAIAAADCVVLPSYREGLPRVILEAAAMSRPVIATDVPGCRQAVENGITGLLCEARSAEAVADAMIAILDMPAEQRAEMGREGRRKAEREFSQDRVAAAYAEALAEALGH